ncbi:hypothetical protein H671_2g6095 [Cricetulus griseus]|uniref:Uncharacterized protein n=1 Tax=Cricetulus griseus TaxID=10029 RepID=A0A061IF66_CRIGR|nr:hypothetical protein H671_2g6095 [Cricetulus griseus]
MKALEKFVYFVEYIDGCSYVEPSLHLWHDAYLIMLDEFSDKFMDSICQCFVEYFYINVHEGYCPQFDYFLESTSPG